MIQATSNLSKSLIAAAVIGLSTLSAHAYCPSMGTYTQVGVNGKNFPIDVVQNDTVIQTGSGATAVWSGDHVLRTYAFLSFDPSIGNGPNFSNINDTDHSAQAGVAFYDYSQGYCWVPATAGLYGITNPHDTQSGGYSGRDIGADGLISMYNQVTTNFQPGGAYSITNAWAGVKSMFNNQGSVSPTNTQIKGTVTGGTSIPPDASHLQSAMGSYSSYAIDKLPTITVSWGGTYEAVAATPTSFAMLNGTDTKFCDPASIANDDMLARAPYVFNGIYCLHLGIQTAATTPPIDTGNTSTPLTIGSSSSPAPRAGSVTDSTITRTTNYQGMDLLTSPQPSQTLSSGCADLTGPHDC